MKPFHAALAGAAIAAVVLTVTSAQTHVPLRQAVPIGDQSGWPPHPSAIVNFATDNLPTIQLNQGEVFSLYSVPADAWFVLTGWSGGDEFTAHERTAAGIMRQKGPRSIYSPMPMIDLSWTFEPGSELVVRREGPGSHVDGKTKRDLCGPLKRDPFRTTPDANRGARR